MVGETSEPGDSVESEFERVTREMKEAWRAADGDPDWIKTAELEWLAAKVEKHMARFQQSPPLGQAEEPEPSSEPDR